MGPSRASGKPFYTILFAFFTTLLLLACKDESSKTTIDHAQLANQYYGSDAQWYIDNIPFFECSDKEIEAILLPLETVQGAIDFGKNREVSKVKMYLYTDDKIFGVPENYTLEYKNGNDWLALQDTSDTSLIGNTVNTITFNKISATALIVNFKHQAKQVAMVELECYE